MAVPRQDRGKIGTVSLVGAGPGDPGLLTLAGAQALTTADTVVYDRLANPSLLDLAQAGAERLFVGKEPGRHTLAQEEINALLAECALQGKTVCRLKGGDPFVFGRGGEEASYLRARGVPVVVIPGVSSAVAVPAYAGIPVTDRRYASSFAVITGHADAGKDESAVDWAGIAHGADTLVFLMGLANLPEITERLIAQGRRPATPAAAIQQGATPAQRVVTGTLETITRRVTEAQLQTPATIIVGEVVRLRETLAWYDTRPLFGKRILVTRSREQAGELTRLLEAAGATPVLFPTIRTVASPPTEQLLPRLQRADWLLFTSAQALPALLAQLENRGADIRALGRARIAAIGSATADSLRAHGLRVDVLPNRFVAEAMAEQIPDVYGCHIVIVRAEEGRAVLPEQLAANGATVDIVPVYRTLADEGAVPDLSTLDAVTFTSSSTVRNFRERITGGVGHLVTACIGPVTATTARELGLRVDIQADDYTMSGLVNALSAYFERSVTV